MDNFGVRAELANGVGYTVIKTRAHRKNHIAVMHGGVGFISAVHAQHTEEVFAGAGISAQAHQGIGHWVIEQINQLFEQMRGIALHYTATGIDHRALGAEQQLHRTQNELYQAGKMAVLGQMSASITHELNQPLTALRTMADNAVLLFERGRTEEARQNLAKISQIVARMGGITGKLKSFARKSSADLAPASMHTAISNALVLVERRLELDKVAFTLDIPPADIYALCDSNRLEQVLLNLMSNALDALGGKIWDAPTMRMYPQHKALLKQAVKTAAAGELFNAQVTMERAGAPTAYLDVAMQPVRDSAGKVAYLLFEARDITELKAAMELDDADAFRFLGEEVLGELVLPLLDHRHAGLAPGVRGVLPERPGADAAPAGRVADLRVPDVAEGSAAAGARCLAPAIMKAKTSPGRPHLFPLGVALSMWRRHPRARLTICLWCGGRAGPGPRVRPGGGVGRLTVRPLEQQSIEDVNH